LEFLTFTLNKEEYGIDIQKVQELRDYDTVTRIANAPPFIKGTVNARGIIVPIVDIRIKLNLSMPDDDQFTAVIVLNLAGCVIGIAADSVLDVIALDPAQVSPVPETDSILNTDYLIGVGTIKQRTLMLIDVAKLMPSDAYAQRERRSA